MLEKTRAIDKIAVAINFFGMVFAPFYASVD
jgi:hypothetical protein